MVQMLSKRVFIEKIGKPLKENKMKVRLFYLSIIGLLLAGGFSACNNKSDITPEEPTATPVEIQLENDTLSVPVGETSTTKILKGGGNYKVINESPDIAVASLENNAITIKSLQKGITACIISDDAGNYKRVTIKSMYMSILLDKEEISISKILGHDAGDQKVVVKKGNGDYQIKSENTDVAQFLRVQGDTAIYIRGVHSGETMVNITDAAGLVAKVKVTVAETDVPYTDNEKAEIMNSNVKRIAWNEGKVINWSGYNYLQAINTKEGNKNKIGFEYQDYQYLRLFFDGDESVGVYDNAKIEARLQFYGPITTFDNVKVEIIKNDGTNVWGIMSVIKNKYLYRGYFCMPKQ